MKDSGGGVYTSEHAHLCVCVCARARSPLSLPPMFVVPSYSELLRGRRGWRTGSSTTSICGSGRNTLAIGLRPTVAYGLVDCYRQIDCPLKMWYILKLSGQYFHRHRQNRQQ
jgi:hypothetical protein